MRSPIRRCAIDVISRIDNKGRIGVFPINAVEGIEPGFRPAVGGWAQFVNDSVSERTARRSGAVEISLGVENHATEGLNPVKNVDADIVQDGFRPSPNAVWSQLKYRSMTGYPTRLGSAIKIAS